MESSEQLNERESQQYFSENMMNGSMVEVDETDAHILKRTDIRPFLVKRFDFVYNNDRCHWTVNVTDIHTSVHSPVTRKMMYTLGNEKEQTMKENREKLMRKEPFSEYIRIVQVRYLNSDETWMGVMASDIMHLTLNSRHNMSHELKKMNCPKTMRVLVSYGKQRQIFRLVTMGAAKKYICDMNVRIKERRVIRQCLLTWVFQRDSMSNLDD